MEESSLQKFWNKRFESFNHTGWKIKSIYDYDQSIRFKAINKFSVKNSISINSGKVFDIGCGTGDFVRLYSLMGANVTGCDLSDDVIAKAKIRFDNFDKVEVFCSDVEQLELPKGNFDLISSITVLMHVVPKEKLINTLNMLNELLSSEGYLLILESKADGVNKHKDSDDFYINIRSTKDWVDT